MMKITDCYVCLHRLKITDCWKILVMFYYSFCIFEAVLYILYEIDNFLFKLNFIL